jgi:cysteine desulfurase/selenocysteine lyase
MGPQGTGFLWGRKELLEKLDPLTTGSRAGSLVNDKTYKESSLPYKFEAGVLNTSGVIGLGRAVQYIDEIGYESIRKHILDLTTYMIKILQSTPKVIFRGSSRLDKQAGIVIWSVEGMDCDRVAKDLDRIGNVIVASGAQGSLLAIQPIGLTSILRTSVHYYNTREDLDSLGHALQLVLKQ